MCDSLCRGVDGSGGGRAGSVLYASALGTQETLAQIGPACKSSLSHTDMHAGFAFLVNSASNHKTAFDGDAPPLEQHKSIAPVYQNTSAPCCHAVD